MNSSQKHILFLTAEVVVGVVIVISFFASVAAKKNLGVPSPSASTNTASVDDHHQPKPADSAVFDSLLGKEAPDFTLDKYAGGKISLKDYRGKNVLLFFNEGLMCYPACWNQIVAFGKDKRFADKNTIVLNVNVDSKSDWTKAIDKMPELAGNPVLLDIDREISQRYGVLTLNSSMHRGQFPGHTYFLIDKDGVIRFARDDEQMAVRNEEMLAEIAKIQ